MPQAGRLRRGTRVFLHPTGTECLIVDRLGAGGQGEVYEARLPGPDGGRPVALKWYFGDAYAASVWHWENLAALVERGAPDGRFLWPVALASQTGAPPGRDGEPFGYVMALRPARFHSLGDVLTRVVRPGLSQLVIAAFQFADSFRQLHSRGWAYRDISEGNAFLDPKSGDIAICDNDNVSVDGESTLVRGTPRYMAPEVLLSNAEPNRLTDLWSLAVLLFHLLVNSHPLEGARAHAIHCLDPAAHRRLFAERPIFIFHPQDGSNRPVPGAQDAPIRLWPLYPESIQALFTRTFVDGLPHPEQRTQEAEWQAALAALRDLVIRCPNCRGESFCDAHQLEQTGVAGTCFRCGARLLAPAHIRLRTPARSSVVMLAPGTRLFPHHFGSTYDYGNAAAEVVTHPERQDALGLRNLSQGEWEYVGTDGRPRRAEPGQTMPILSGVSVSFGRVQGTLRA